MVTNFDQRSAKGQTSCSRTSAVCCLICSTMLFMLSIKNQKPLVRIISRKLWSALQPKMDRVIIKVKDNGNGIPETIKDKIMQPFFTTKPTGEGTGLGFSLSYDIVVKGHGGEININSVNGKGAEFIIQLPVN